MRKIIAISFLFIYLLSTTELYQLLKMPLLFEHYLAHRSETRELTLGQFLYLHYAAGDVEDADYASDMELPFKSHDKVVSAISNFYVSLQDNFSVLPFKQVVKMRTFPLNEDFSLSTFLSSIWQPPRV